MSDGTYTSIVVAVPCRTAIRYGGIYYKCPKCGYETKKIRKDGCYPKHLRPMNRAFRRPGRRAWEIDVCSFSGTKVEAMQ